MAEAGGFVSSVVELVVVVVGGFILVIGRISVFRWPSWAVGLVLPAAAGASLVSWSSFLAREVVEAARGNRHFGTGWWRWFDLASVFVCTFYLQNEHFWENL